MLYDEINQLLQNDYDKRLTQTEMAKKYNITQERICKLLSDRKSIYGIKLETLQKMFPSATIYGNNTVSNSQISNNQGFINSHHNNFLSSGKTELIQDIIDKLLIDNDLNDTEKVKFMQFIRKLK